MTTVQRVHQNKTTKQTFKSNRKMDTTKLYDMSTNAAELLNLPKEKF